MTYPKSTSHRCFPLFRSLAPLSSGQKRSMAKTMPIVRGWDVLFAAPRPMPWVGMCDVAACVLSNPLTFRRGIQSLRIVPPDIFSFEKPPPVAYSLDGLNPVSLDVGITFILHTLLLGRRHRATDAALVVCRLLAGVGLTLVLESAANGNVLLFNFLFLHISNIFR